MYFISIDVSDLERKAANLEATVKKAAEMAGNDLAPAIHAHVLEEANKKLHTRRQMFVDAVSFKKENAHTWLIVLDRKAQWIESGQNPHSMIDDLLSDRGGGKNPHGVKGKGVQVGKDGSRYRSIPFFHGPGKGQTNSTPAEQVLNQAIRKELKTRNIPYGKLETDSTGKPKLGLLHSFTGSRGMDTPAKTSEGPGQGQGPMGSPRQGPTGIPFLDSLRIYQRMTKNPDGSQSVKRAIMSFRTVSSKQINSGKWYSPGSKPVNIFAEAFDWGKRHWDEEIAPKLIDYISANL